MLAILLLTTTVFGASFYWMNQKLPQVVGELTISGLMAPVQVIRDERGVPHIIAQNDHDLYLAQGYVTAQDRLFQMDLSRRQASGQLSELFGESALNQDKYFRTLGLRRAAEASYQAYSDSSKQILQWYADGVNAFIQQGNLPVEFTLLNYQPMRWTPIDSLTIGKFMAFELGGHWEEQAFRSYLLQTFPEDKAKELMPTHSLNTPTIIPKDELDLAKAFAHVTTNNPLNGSNDWVISGTKTASGKPILADDPHLGLNTPSIWYQTHLQGPEVNVSGVIFAGIPGIILGHNEHIAWGVTNTGPDVQDLYIEKRNPDNPNQFLYQNQWETATIIQEPIKVKGEPTVPYQVTITRHGPVISEFADEVGKNTVLSLKWTALEPSKELEAVLNMNKAKNWEQFEKALTDFHAPMQNFVFASTDGTISYKANGKLPIRKKGDSLLPVPGWTDEYEWTGYVPFDQLPKIINPKQGFIVTANNKVIDDSYPYHITHNWLLPYRAMRITEVLQGKENITANEMQQLQMDVVNIQARELTPILLERLDQKKMTSLEQEGFHQLQSWSYEDQAELASPLIYHRLLYHLEQIIFQDQITPEMIKLFRNKEFVLDSLIRRAHLGQNISWFEEKQGFDAVVQNAFTKAINEIVTLQGTHSQDWNWGDFHQIQFNHPLSAAWYLSPLYSGSKVYPTSGSQHTVKAMSYDHKTGMVYHGASWRYVIDMANSTVAYHILGPGQSGNVLSRWYDNQADDWILGKYHPVILQETSGRKLILQPK
ncbi:penicillin acylase family protein [Risungbinella massiliensis]|uniref:penicillin acylase family protein n=1 Tax=Risungbinella massiliensis TaxID=1329796 RepID=UPI0005CBD2AE|nr:penicillin acylase family protein [Risungbinella massiliensis]